MNIGVFYALVAFSALMLGLALLITILKPLAFPLLWAVIIGMAAQPIHNYIKKSIKREMLSSLSTTILLTVIILLPFIILTEMLTMEVIRNYNTLQGWFEKGVYPPLELLKNNPIGNVMLTKIHSILSYFGTDIKSALLLLSERLTKFVLESSGEVIKNIFVFMIKFVFMIITLFFLFKDGARWGDRLREIIPLEKEQIGILRHKLHQMIYAVFYGILLTALVQGTMAGIGYITAGVKSPVLLGAATAIFSLIPVIGTTIVWVPVVGYLFLTGNTSYAIGLGLWCILVVGTIDNMIRPLFISGQSKTPLFLTIIGVFGGLAAFGFIGIVLGPLILVTSSTLLEFYLTEYRQSSSISSQKED